MKNKKTKIPGYSLYSTTRDGRVWTNRLRKGWLNPGIDKNGYIRYELVGDNGKRKSMYIHQVVARTFIPNPENKPFVNHLDHNKSNNCVENLQWCTHLENIRHDWAMGKRKVLKGEALNRGITTEAIAKEVRRLKELCIPQKDLAIIFGISQSTVSQIIRRVTWRHI